MDIVTISRRNNLGAHIDIEMRSKCDSNLHRVHCHELAVVLQTDISESCEILIYKSWNSHEV